MQTSKPAVRVNQGTLTIYATSLKVKDLMVEGFYLVDKLDSADESSGFQRVLDKARTKRLAEYILNGETTMPPLNIDTGNTAFMLLCSILVMLMTPGLAFFYGGPVGRERFRAIMYAGHTN